MVHGVETSKKLRWIRGNLPRAIVNRRLSERARSIDRSIDRRGAFRLDDPTVLRCEDRALRFYDVIQDSVPLINQFVTACETEMIASDVLQARACSSNPAIRPTARTGIERSPGSSPSRQRRHRLGQTTATRIDGFALCRACCFVCEIRGTGGCPLPTWSAVVVGWCSRRVPHRRRRSVLADADRHPHNINRH